jgi:hypothetical protein
LTLAAGLPPFEIWETDAARDSAAPAARWVLATARHLLAAPPDSAMPALLSVLGREAAACRAWLIDYSWDLTRIRNKYEWCREGLAGHVRDLQDVPVTLVGWLHREMLAGHAVMIHDVARLPRAARPLQVEMQRQHDTCVLSVPLFHRGRLRGLWGFDATGVHPGWTRAHADALVLCGSLVAQARCGPAPAPGPQQAATPLAPVVYLRTRSGVRSVALADILGVQSNGDYVLLHLADGTTLLDLRPLKQWESLLPFARFMRTHRTAIVAVRRVQGLERRARRRRQLRLAGVRQPRPVSRERIAQLRSRLGY